MGADRPAHFSGPTVLYGILFGVLFVATLEFYYFAMQSGPLSYTGFFFSASMLIPSVAGLLFWKEPLTWKVGLGILLFLAAFYCITVLGGAKGGKFNKRWLILCFFTWAGNGSLSLVMNFQQRALKRPGHPLGVSPDDAGLLCGGLWGGGPSEPVPGQAGRPERGPFRH